MTLGSLLIQKQRGFSDRELVEEITENPYFQYFIGLPGYQTEPPFVPSLLVEFRKRLTDDLLGEINEMIIAYNALDDPTPGGGNKPDAAETDTAGNNKTLILDAACAPRHISFPQDVNLLNEVRENLEGIIDDLCRRFDYYVPRMYRKNAHIAVERAFALAKQKYELGLITSRLDETTRCSIVLSVIAINVDRICRSLLRLFYDIVIARYKQHEFMVIFIQNNNAGNLVCC